MTGSLPIDVELNESPSGAREVELKEPTNGARKVELEESSSSAYDAFAPREGHSLTWSSVNLAIGGKTILSDVQGGVLPGQLTGIMGHSGSGKSSLLNILSGKVRNGDPFKLSHRVTFDGLKIDPASLEVRRKIAFVAQQDVLPSTATAKEAISFSARLRLPNHVSDEEIEQLTSSILEVLGFRDGLIDKTLLANMSGGEKRRISCGVELVVRPSIMLIDEITSGLDSYSALHVMDVLKKVSLCGASVLLTIHQPTSQVFQKLDDLILMHKGCTMYNGSVSGVSSYFAERGFELPREYSMPDWAIHVSQSSESTQALRDAGFFPESKKEEEESEKPMRPKLKRQPSIFEVLEKSERASFTTQMSELMKREMTNVVRNKDSMLIRLSSGVGGGALIALFLYGVGKDTDDASSFQSHVGAMYFMILACSVASQIILLEFADGRPLFVREYATNHFSLQSYFLAKLFTESVTIFLQIFLYTLITFWSIGLQGRFWYMLFCFYFFGMAASSIGVLLASVTRDPKNAKELIPLAILPQILLSGFFVSVDDLPSWVSWLTYLMPLTYSFRLALAEEFSECDLADEEQHSLDCLAALQNSGFQDQTNGPWYDESSLLLSPQLGEFEGGDAIEEYFSIVDSQDGLGAACSESGTVAVKVFPSEEGKCRVGLASIVPLAANPAYTAIPNVESLRFASLRGDVLHFDLLENDDDSSIVVNQQNLFYSDESQHNMFGKIVDQEKSSREICEVMQSRCSGIFQANTFDTIDDCVSQFMTLPKLDTTEDSQALIDGNSTGCRLVQSILARGNKDHCPHISFEPMEDSAGEIKCSESAKLTVEDVFQEDELDFFGSTGEQFGLDRETLSIAAPVAEFPMCGSSSFQAESLRAASEAMGEDAFFLGLCSGYLEQNKASRSYQAQYWGTLVGLILALRLAATVLLRNRVHSSQANK